MTSITTIPDEPIKDSRSKINTNFDNLNSGKAETTDLTSHTGDTANPHSTSDANLSTSDITTNNASVSKHGFLKKLPGNSGQFLDGNGNFSVPAGGGDVLAPATNTDSRVPQWDGADSKTLKDGLDFIDDDSMATASATSLSSSESIKAYVDANSGGGMNNLLKNGNFINNSSNGYGTTPDDWTNSNANPVQGGFPSMTKQQLIDLLGISDGDIEGLWNLNEASGNALDLSSNGYELTDTNTVGASEDGLMGKARDFEKDNSEYFTIADASCPNLEISGSQTWFAFVKVESFDGNDRAAMGKRDAASGNIHDLGFDGSTSKPFFRLVGLTTTSQILSSVVGETGKWYFLCGIYDSVNSKIKIWVNGLKSEATASGSTTDTNGDFSIGRLGASNANYFDGLIQCSGVLSVALTDSQVKKLFAATLYRGQKIRRATTNAYISQSLPENLVERLRGKEVSIVARAYQEVASTAQVSIDDGTETASATVATTGSWLDMGVSKTISATATSITIKLKHSTSDGNTWFKEVAFYEGGTLVYVWYPSYDDIHRFSKALRMDFADKNKGYRVEGDLAYFAGALTTTELVKDGEMGYDTANNRLYIREQGVVKYVAMT